MANEMRVRLRDRREPGHFWIDNEILDVFGDDLGHNGIGVYGAMARFCYGTEVKISLREIAAAARMSKDTVARSMKVLVSLGLVIETKAKTSRTASSWALVSVKALVQAMRTQSVSPSVSGGDSAQVEATAGIFNGGKDKTLVELVKERAGICLTGRQIENGKNSQDHPADFSVDKKNCVAQDATDLSQKDPRFETDLSHQPVPVKYKTQDTKQKTSTNPQTPAVRGPSDSNLLGAEQAKSERHVCEEAVRKVMRECDVSDPRMFRVIELAMATEHAKTDAPADCNRTAERMIAARHEFVRDGALMSCRPGVRKFFGHGLWADWRTWPYDQKRLSEARRF